ncbi:helix-turn-helix domain-containing protein [Azospirillum sp. sgz302134]
MSNVVTLPPKAATPPEADKAFPKRWGAKVADHGYVMVPEMLLAFQGRLRLRCTEVTMLLQIMTFWWAKGGLPWPSKARLAERLGVTERQVQRTLTKLEKRGFIKRQERFYGSGSQTSNAYDLSGLIAELKRLEPEYRAAKEKAKAERAEVEKMVPGEYNPVK